MKKELFNKMMPFIFQAEGGYSDDAYDSGGKTKYGISQQSYPNLNIKNLTPAQAKEIYYKDYWLKIATLSDNDNVVAALFDTAVNHGVSYASTLKGETVEKILLKRLTYYSVIVKKNSYQKMFIFGWLNRVLDLQKYIEIHI